MKATSQLRKMLEGDEIIVAPGAYDPLSARIVEAAGFGVVYMTGYGASAAYLGRPDIGLMGMSEVVGHAGRMAAAVSIPLISDADTGYGGIHNVMRTVQEFERAGVAGIHIEDQVTPKRCGHMKGVKVVPLEEMIRKIEAACEARTDPDFVIIARTDSVATDDLDEGIRRGRAMAKAGADVVFVESLQSKDDMEKVVESIDAPLLVNMMEDGLTPLLTAEELQKIGFKIVIFALSSLYVVVRAMTELMGDLKATGTSKTHMGKMTSNEAVNDLLGLSAIQEIEERHSGSHKEQR